MKILSIVGARPQFIKAAVVSHHIKTSSITEVIIHTGQHYDENMSDIFFEQMKIPRPNYTLSINGLSHGAMTGRMMEEIEKIIIIEKPSYLMVYGDTNSTLAGALAAKKLNVKVIHIEAGLRSFNMQMPEEVNRILTDRISDILFCPTDSAIENLKNEGFDNFDCKVIKVGDVMEDACNLFLKQAELESKIIDQLDLNKNKFILCTLHRAENTDDEERLRKIAIILNDLSKEYKIILPIHPRTKAKIKEFNIKLEVNIIDPVGYFDMMLLLQNCSIVITDSGGLQKEAYFFNKFCITLRDQTEWVELVENGFNLIVSVDYQKAINGVKHFQSNTFERHIELYGEGKAVKNILSYLES